MTKEELLSKQTFIDLLEMTPLDQIERESELYLEAEKLGIKSLFKANLKQYRQLLNKSKLIGNKLDISNCKYDISNYNMGKYNCSMDGITDDQNYKFSYIPVLPVERFINQETGKEKIKIIFYKDDEWKELTIDKSQITINQKLLLLSDYGLDVNSENVKYYINYFNDILNLNNIKKLNSVSHLGWFEDSFIPYDTKGMFDGENDFKNIFSALKSKGNYDLWLKTIKEARKQQKIKILMGVVLASPLLEKLSIQPYIANFWSSMSGNGKTLSSMLVMSIWGDPSPSALRLSSNSTQNFIISVASFMRNITCYYDELQIIKNNKYMDLNGLVMDLCNGTEKGRLNKNSQAREVKSWNCNFLFTNNDKMVKENAGEQIYNRVIDIEVNEMLYDNPNQVSNIILNNYGFLGKDYIKIVKKIGFDKLRERYVQIYNEILSKTKATDKQASSLASIILADEIIVKNIFKDEKCLSIEDIEDLVNDRDEIRTSIKAKEYIISIINANPSRFNLNNYGEVWGEIKECFDENEKIYKVTINAQILNRELKKGGFEFETIKKEWADMGFLEKNSVGRYTHQTTLNKEKGIYIVLKLT